MIDKIKAVIKKLPHSEKRVPYTYHHDYLRMNTDVFEGASRVDVAETHRADILQLYATALIYLADEVGSDLVKTIDADDLYVCQKAKDVCNDYITQYQYG